MWAEGAGECLSTSAFGASKGLPWGLMVFLVVAYIGLMKCCKPL